MTESGRARYTYSKMHGLSDGFSRALPRVQPAVVVDEDRLARRDVAHEPKAHALQRDRFGRDEIFATVVGVALAEHERPDAERVAEREHAVARDLRDDRIRALARADAVPRPP